MNLMSVPPASNTCRVASEKYAFNIAAVASALIPSAIEVNRLMSVKTAVPTISWPPRLTASGSSAIRRIISGERYSPNARLIFSRSRTVVR